MINWLKGLLNVFSKTPEVAQSVDKAKVDHEIGKTFIPNRGEVSTRKSNKSAKPARVRSDNKSQTPRKRTGAAVRAAATKGKGKSKTVSKD